MYNLPDDLQLFSVRQLPSLSERITKLAQTVAAGKQTVVYLYSSPDFTIFRYRCYNMVQALEQDENWGGTWFYSAEFSEIRAYLPSVAILVMVRLKWTSELDEMVFYAKKNGVAVLYDIDDYIFEPSNVKLLENTIGDAFREEIEYDFWFANASRIEAAARLADGCTATNPILADLLKKKLDKPTWVLPNTLNKEQITLSEQLCAQKKNCTRQMPFVIGYFSGTPSHRIDFSIVAPELFCFLQDCAQTQLLIVGELQLPRFFAPMVASSRVIQTPLTDYLTLQHKMALVDVCIAPLTGGLFNDCKSDLKFFESGIVSTPICASDSAVMKNSIQHGVDGLICQQGQWYEALQLLYRDTNMLERLGHAAQYKVMQQYTPTQLHDSILVVYKEVAKK